MANGISDKGARIRPLLAQAVEPDADGFYNGTRVIPVAEYDFDTGLPVATGTGTANGVTTDGRRIQAVRLTEVEADAHGFYNGTRVHYVQKYDWNTGALVFAPDSLGASLLGFWDPQRADLITQSAGAVSSFKDTVAAYDTAQATGSSQPAYSATSFNSGPGLTFDGTDDFLGMESVPFPTGANPCEIWALVDQTALVADTNVRRAAHYGGASINASRGIGRSVVGGVNRASVFVGSGSAVTQVDNTSVILSGRHVLRGVIGATEARIDVDGVAGTPTSVVPATDTTRFRIGASSNTSAANFWQGGIGGVLVTAPLTDAQAAQLLAFLKARGGVA
jgi:hypothetical protein